MASGRLRVGIVGLQPHRSWAARAHIPALRSLSQSFELVGVANSTKTSSEAAAASCGIPRAFANAVELAQSPEIDIVTVTVRVPRHREIVLAALDAGKHVYCEWPLGRSLAEAEELAALARSRGVLAVIGTQARVAPAMVHLRRLIGEGYVGDVLSTSVSGWGRGWGASIDSERESGYLLDAANGATLLSIPLGHTLAALRDVLGDLSSVAAVIENRRPHVLVENTGATLPMNAPDQVLVCGTLTSGAALSIHYQGGLPRDGQGLIWTIHGTEGDLRVMGPSGHVQMMPLTLWGTRGAGTLEPIAMPDDCGFPDVIPGNVAKLYARMAADLSAGTRTAPDFDDAVQLHRVLAAIEISARTGQRVALDAPNRRLPGN